MTFAIVMSAPNGMWACADRQLSYNDFHPQPAPDAVKISILRSQQDGIGILTYAGLGKLYNTEVSRWVTQTLSGRDASIDGMMRIICGATEQKISPKWQHRFIGIAAGYGQYQGARMLYRLANPGQVGRAPVFGRYVRAEAAGSGSNHIKEEIFRVKRLKRLILRFEDRHLSAITVAKEFAQLNIVISERRGISSRKNDVSRECIVVYVPSTMGVVPQEWAFDQKGNVSKVPFIVPFISNGVVLSELFLAMLPFALGGAPMHPAHALGAFLHASRPPDEEFH